MSEFINNKTRKCLLHKNEMFSSISVFFFPCVMVNLHMGLNKSSEKQRLHTVTETDGKNYDDHFNHIPL